MALILKQRKLIFTRRFEITNRSLKIEISTPFSFLEDEIAFEDITTRYFRKKSFNVIIGCVSLFMLLVLAIAVNSHFNDSKDPSSLEDIQIIGFLAIVVWIIFFLSFENVINVHLVDSKPMVLYAASPNAVIVEDFLKDLRTAQKEFLLKTYAKADPFISREQMNNNLQWLWNRNIVDEKELLQLKKNLLPAQISDSGVGFKFGSEPGKN